MAEKVLASDQIPVIDLTTDVTGILPAANLPGIWEVVYDAIEDGDVASRAISGLIGDTDEEYLLVYRLVGTNVGASYLRLQFETSDGLDTGNNYYDATHYYGQATHGSSAATIAYATLGVTTANDYVSHGVAHIYAKTGFYRGVVTQFTRQDADVGYNNATQWRYDTSKEIIGMTISPASGNLAIGTHITLYKKSKVSVAI